MDFAATLERVGSFLRERDVSFAVIGGVALAAYGVFRQTLDLDFVVDAEAQDDLVEFMESLGYRTLYRSSGYSNHAHGDAERGRVDFVYVRGPTSEKLFRDVRRLEGPNGTSIPVPRPEHLIAMKLVAIKNDPTRELQDLADIRGLMERPDVDRGFVRAELERHGLMDRFDELT